MPKAMTIAGLVVAGLLALTFVADLALGVPFGRAQIMMDVGALVGAGLLGYLSWDAMREIH